MSEAFSQEELTRDAAKTQPKPHGTGRNVMDLMKEELDTRNFQYPEEGLITIQLWARSAAFFLLFRRIQQTSPDLSTSETFLKAKEYLKRDVEARSQLGKARYGESLRAFNGRDAELDLYQEVLDAWAYARQCEEEKL